MTTKKIIFFPALFLVSGVVEAGEPAGIDSGFAKDSGIDLAPPPSASGWEVGLGAAPIFGAEAGFSGLGQWRSPHVPPPLAGTQDRFYDNGFNRVDATGNAGNLTSYWSYDDRAAQYDPTGGGGISMSIFNSRASAGASEDEVGWGGELFASKAFGNVNLSFAPEATWGLRLGFHVNNFAFDNNGSLSTLFDVTTDTFGLGGAVAPQTPFTGSPAGFGNAVLSDQATRTTSVQTGSVAGSREFDVSLFGFTAGPYLEIPLRGGFSVRGEAGLALAIAHGDYSFSSSTTVAGGGTQSVRGSDSEVGLLPGFFAGVSTIYQLNTQWRLHGGVRYQFYDDFDVEAGNSKAELELSSSFQVLLGASYSF